MQILFLTEHNFQKEKKTDREHQDLLYKDISLILTGHRSETLKLVVATSLSGSCASFSFTRNLLNKQSLYSIFINKIIIKGCLYLKTGFNLQFGNYNRYPVLGSGFFWSKGSRTFKDSILISEEVNAL